MADATTLGSDTTPLYEIVITLLDVGVDVDRRVVVPSDVSLANLHRIIQAAMGWDNNHLHEFRVPGGATYGSTSIDEPSPDELAVRVADVLRHPGDKMDYEYDFGDSWQHRVELAAVRTRDGAEAVGAACIGGRGSCPPEDCGGAMAYREMCRALTDPNAKKSARRSEEWPWWWERWDPLAFSLEGANSAVSSLTLGDRRTP